MSKIDELRQKLNMELLEMLDASLKNTDLSSANVHVQLAFTIASLREQQILDNKDKKLSEIS